MLLRRLRFVAADAAIDDLLLFGARDADQLSAHRVALVMRIEPINFVIRKVQLHSFIVVRPHPPPCKITPVGSSNKLYMYSTYT